MPSHSSMVYWPDLEPVWISSWDMANIMEYTVSQFTVIRLALGKSHVPWTIMFQKLFIQHLLWEADVGMLDDEGFFTKFFDHKVNILGESHLLASYHIVLVYQYSWWKDQFDVIPFEMPHCIQPDELIELYQEHAKQLMTVQTFIVHAGSHITPMYMTPWLPQKSYWVLKNEVGQVNHIVNGIERWVKYISS
ncbi:uncharacterized protein BJ212DRAFT_1296391 [Suillus subaureus]|uniref:Uncharacterized protein n=1 Tax=Suillus subaureus TaxID=48587 RepID=A0A9P7EKA2_9AGAM|nr:uncharacterized protein BJ212DRAFT_1296391 [Suillus subaureus]KAG1823866.1 hypothetical protein BJ212DRAFT_1296391 [Suillus subaureus]